MSKKLLVLDVDNTFIVGNTWEKFNTALGISLERDYELYQQYHTGTISYQTWQALLHAEYIPDVPKTHIETILHDYTLAPGATACITAAKDLGIQTVLLSGGFQEVAEAIQQELSVDFVRTGTRCVYTKNEAGVDVFTHFVSKGEEKYVKVALLQELCVELGINLTDCIAVGDGSNDLEVFALTGQSVTFTSAKPEVQTAATHTITDLTELPNLLETVADTSSIL